MASNFNEEDEEGQQVVPDNSAYNQLWQEALDVDEEVQRILRDHAMPINDDELEHPEEAEEEDEIQ
jgi:rRNA-processing protein FCF1